MYRYFRLQLIYFLSIVYGLTHRYIYNFLAVKFGYRNVKGDQRRSSITTQSTILNKKNGRYCYDDDSSNDNNNSSHHRRRLLHVSATGNNNTTVTTVTDQILTSSIDSGRTNNETSLTVRGDGGNRAEKLMAMNLELMTNKMAGDEKDKLIKSEFEICANVLDRVALVFFVCMFVMITVVYLVATT